MTDACYVTTTIPYVNAPPHVGFALELVQADAVARYRRLLGFHVRFQTGTDENAFKNVLSARERGVPVERLVNENAARFRALCHALAVSHDTFVRTTSAGHREAVAAFLSRLRPSDLYRASYRGLYCASCEDFYLERDLNGGLCPEHRAPVVPIEENNHFFRLSAYRAPLTELIASRRLRVIPESREAEVLRFLERGLTDISISRDAVRSGGWGIPFPGDPSQVVYVWIDALVNYLSGLGYPAAGWDRVWCERALKLHLIGKNVWKFHAVYWPALLLSTGLPLPDQVVAHGFLTVNGRKISKSSGAEADPIDYVNRFGPDAVRYFLLRHAAPFEDTDFAVSRLEQAYVTHLANGLGNLCSRLTTLCEAAQVAGSACADQPPAPPSFHEQLEAYRFDRALDLLWGEVARINREINAARPWQDLKAGRTGVARERLTRWVAELSAVGYWLQPFLPATGARIRDWLARRPIRRCPPLFPRTVGL